MENERKGLIVPLLLGIVVLLIAGGSFYFYQNKEVVTQDAIPDIQKINCDKYYNIPNFGPCLISPDGQLALSESREGLKIITSPDKIDDFSTSRYDRAGLWFSDSRRILGFAGSFPSMDCEGNAIQCPRGVPDNRKIVIWDVVTKTYSNIGVQTPPLSFDMEWIVPDHTAYIYAVDMSGSEGDNFYYILDLDADTISGPTKNSQLR
jgi:hypothetical protein